MSETLVFIPGLMCDHAVWEPLLPWLDGTLPWVTADHGNADNLVTMAQQVLERTAGPLALAGHSMGGRVALEVLRLAPERVSRVALLDTGYLPRATGAAGEAEVAKRHALLCTAQTEGVRAMAAQWVQGMVHPDRLADADFIERIVAMFARQTAGIFGHQIRALLARPDASDVLASIRVPARVICGEQDLWSPPDQHRAMVALMPTGTPLDLIAHSGHMSPMEQPEAVARMLLDWLSA